MAFLIISPMHGGKTPNSWEHCFIVCFVSRSRDPAGSLYVVEWSGTPNISASS